MQRKAQTSRGSKRAPSAQPPTAQPENRDKDDDESMPAGAGNDIGQMDNMLPQQRNLGLGRGGRSKRNCNLIRPQSLRVVDSQVSACFFAAALLLCAPCAPGREMVLRSRIRLHARLKLHLHDAAARAVPTLSPRMG